MMLQLDHTTEVMLGLLVEHERGEPVEPDPDRHVLEEIRLVARRRDEWEKHRDALWLMVSARLAAQAVDEYPDAV